MHDFLWLAFLLKVGLLKVKDILYSGFIMTENVDLEKKQNLEVLKGLAWRTPGTGGTHTIT